MARMNIDAAPSTGSYSAVEKLSLEAGERARIFMVEGASWLVEYSHELRHVARPTKAQEAAGVTSSPQDFAGNFICLGDPSILGQGMPDTNGCPFCREQAASNGKVLPAKAAFATNIIRYATPKSSHELTRPAQVQLLAWIHRDDRKRRIILELQNEWKDLTQHDILVTCNNQFQQYDISVAARTAFAEDSALETLIQEVYRNNKYDDDALTQALGKRVDAHGAEAAISSLGRGAQQAESSWTSAADLIAPVEPIPVSTQTVAAMPAPVAVQASVAAPVAVPVDLHGLGGGSSETAPVAAEVTTVTDTPPVPSPVELPPLTPPPA